MQRLVSNCSRLPFKTLSYWKQYIWKLKLLRVDSQPTLMFHSIVESILSSIIYGNGKLQVSSSFQENEPPVCAVNDRLKYFLMHISGRSLESCKSFEIWQGHSWISGEGLYTCQLQQCIKNNSKTSKYPKLFVGLRSRTGPMPNFRKSSDCAVALIFDCAKSEVVLKIRILKLCFPSMIS